MIDKNLDLFGENLYVVAADALELLSAGGFLVIWFLVVSSRIWIILSKFTIFGDFVS